MAKLKTYPHPHVQLATEPFDALLDGFDGFLQFLDTANLCYE